MLFPSIFDDSFDDWFDFSFPKFDRDADKKLYGKHAANLMKTDVQEKDHEYVIDVDLPGFKKEDIQIQLKNGNLVISAAKGLEENEKNKAGKYIHQERYMGNVSRSFYVGEDMKQEDIHAKFENGVLCLTIPKKEEKKVEEHKYIAIE